MAASGNLHPGKTSMFEPVHGSAPKFAGKNVANPIGAIASASLMLETLGLTDEAAAIDAAILRAVRERQVTQDVGGTLGTKEAGDFIAHAVLPMTDHDFTAKPAKIGSPRRSNSASRSSRSDVLRDRSCPGGV